MRASRDPRDRRAAPVALLIALAAPRHSAATCDAGCEPALTPTSDCYDVRDAGVLSCDGCQECVHAYNTAFLNDEDAAIGPVRVAQAGVGGYNTPFGRTTVF